ncbi:MAG: response regulator [Acidobacteriota bacterium]|jgi:two-component system, cell cycle response regulator DivK
MSNSDLQRGPADILLVEDNPQNLELAEFLLEEAGWRVRTAKNARQAREAIQDHMPDLILMDIYLPGCSGLDLVREIRLMPGGSELSIVALTAHAMRGDRERFLKGGCTGYIAKPIDVKLFVSSIRRYLQGH